MFTFNQSAFVNAPVEKVFALVSDPLRIPEWRKDVPKITVLNGTSGAGTEFFEEVQFMGRKQLRMRITELVPNQKLVIEAQSGMSLLPTQSFVFTGEGGKTRIDLSVTMKTSGIFRLMEFMLPGKLKQIWAKYFQNLDTLLKA